MSQPPPDDFVQLHTHSEYSNFDGCGKMTDFIARSYEQGARAMAFTEHGTIRQLTNFAKACGDMADEGKPMRPIYGAELYLCEDMSRKGATPEELESVLAGVPGRDRRQKIYEYERDNNIIGRFHLTVLAKDNVGLKNLSRVVSLGWTKGFYKRPRVDLATLVAHHDGLVVLSGCQSGSIGGDFLPEYDNKTGALVRPSNPYKAMEKVELLHATFGDDFYGEIMPHNMAEQAQVNKAVRMISSAYGMKLVTTQDAHYINPEDWRYQEAMLCINTRTTLADPNRFKFSTQDFWLKSRRDLAETYRAHHGYLSKELVKQSLDMTVEIAEKCQAKLELDRFKALVPAVEMPPEYPTTPEGEARYLRHLAMEGWRSRGLDRLIKEEARRRRIAHAAALKMYQDRMNRELDAMEKQKVVRYFLVVWDLYKWVRGAAIEVGPGRGSVGGSLVAFLIGLTDIDPIRFDLLFERFLAPSRIDMPDVDMDFEDTRRQEVISYLRRRWGDDCTAQISANGKLTGKACLKDIARIMDIPLRDVQPVVDAIVARSSGDERASQTIEDSFEEFEVCRAFNRKYPDVLEYAKKLEGQVKSLGMHAAGVVVAPGPLIELVPLEIRQEKSDNPIVVTAVDMYGVADLGLMKLDVLGIRNLSAMRLCREAVKERHGVDIDWLAIPLDDQATLDNFTKHEYIGVFQFDTISADKISEGVEFTSFEDVAAMIALDRPGTARSGLATEYLKRKKDPKQIKSIHPIVDAICADTLGVIVYQEHVQRMFTDVAGFPAATADSLRRKIAKKLGDEAIAKERTQFVEGAVERGMDRELASKLIEQIKFFGSYGFNKAHSVAYGLIGYREMWLKTHYPLEFMWAILAVEPDTKEIIRIVRATRRMDIEVRPPDVNAGDPTRWSLVGNAIVGALSNIKGVGEKAVEAIAAARPFTDFIDFCARVDRKRVHKGVVKALNRAGAFGDLVPNNKWLDEHLEWVWERVVKGNAAFKVFKHPSRAKPVEDWRTVVEAALVNSVSEPDWSEDEANIISAKINPLATGTDPLENHAPLAASMRDNWLKLDAEDLFNRKSGWIWGRVIERKYNQIGDFHNGAEPDDETKAKMGWGRRYANINVEDSSGRNQRIKIDPDVFDRFRHIIDSKTDLTIACHVSVNSNAQFRSMKASFLVDMDEVALKIANGDDLNTWELCLYKGWTPGDGPSRVIFANGKLTVSALVARVFTKLDKKEQEMAFITLICADGRDRDVLCFGSSWPAFKHRVRVGLTARFTVSALDRGSFSLDDAPNVLVIL